MNDPGEWGKAIALIRDASNIALACHVNPDGDALGSMLGFGLALREAGRASVASFSTGGAEESTHLVPRPLRFLPGQDLLVPPADFPAEPEVMITFDAASAARLGALSAVRPRNLIVVDHHQSNTRFGSINLIEPDAAATAVLAERMIADLGVALTRDIAVCLYTGLMTDTGSFRYSATTPAVHRLAARLLEAGVAPDEIATAIWDSASFGYLRVLAAALARARLEPELIWTYVPRAERAAHEVPYDELEGIIDVVRRTGDAPAAVVLKEDDQGLWQVSARSRGGLDVGRACTAMGGGGHERAAGFTSDLPVEETMARFRAALRS